METVYYNRIAPDLPIIGFTGALGSGCTFFGKALEENHNYYYCSLSAPIHKFAEDKGHEKTSENLQDIGDELRKEKGSDILVRLALDQAEEDLAKSAKKYAGIIVDGIRNTAEVNRLRAWPYFYLISIHADREKRLERILSRNSNDTAKAECADKRDQQGTFSYGQQVRQCNDMSDIILSNDKHVSDAAIEAKRKYTDSKLYDRYLTLIERLAQGEISHEHHPNSDEALMTAAYVESKQSSCLKRKVGAVIACPDGTIISAGHNDVPPGTKSCLEDPDYGWCARDVLLGKVGQKFNHCPGCGQQIDKHFICSSCKTELNQFYRSCPECNNDPEIEWTCIGCNKKVFSEYLPGKSPDTGKLLDVCRALHAEENAILNLSKNGVRPPEGSILYTTTFPCNLCANKIVSAGIRQIVYAEPYITKEAQRLFDEKEVKLRRFEGVKSSAYFRLYDK